MTKTSEGLVKWAIEAHKHGWVYWYGTCGYVCTSDLLKRKTNQYGKPHYVPEREAKYKKHIAAGKVCADCIGLFKSYAWDEDDNIATRDSDYGSNGHPDQGAKTVLSKCKVKGDISAMPEIPGLAVWTKTGGHIGLYVGNGEVIELRGFSYGCKRSKLSERSFTTWGLYPYVLYSDEHVAMAKAAAGTYSPTLRKGSNGSEVKELQNLLISHGYKLPQHGADGDYGVETVNAVKRFQKDNGLTSDGICGAKTWAALRATHSVKYKVTIPGVSKAVAGEIVAKYGGEMIEEV